MRKIMPALGLGIIILMMSLAAGQEEDSLLKLQIGNPRLKMKTISVFPGRIYSAEKGTEISFRDMIAQMIKSRIVYVGETHNSLPIHNIQYRIADALYAVDRSLVIGLEMFDVTRQEPLNKWSLGLLTEEEFIDQARWYESWNFNFQYYKKIFDLAKEYKIPVYALNAPRSIIHKIRMQGWKALSDEEKQIVPNPDLANKDHRALMKAIFGDAEMPKAMKAHGGGAMMFEALYRSQSAWDEVMAANALRAADNEGKRVIVFAGSGHLLYNLGINRRAYEKKPFPSKTVICVEIPEGKTEVAVSRSLGDYIWGLKEEVRPAFPSDGIALKKFDGLDNPVIGRDPVSGVAKGENFKKGDIILAVDGQPYSSINSLRKYLSKFTWGDEVSFDLLRQVRKIKVKMKFTPPTGEKGDQK